MHKYLHLRNKFTSVKEEGVMWPESDSLLPSVKDNRLFNPDVTFESSYSFDVIRNKIFNKSREDRIYHDYSISIINGSQFPYSEGKMATSYFYCDQTVISNYTKCLHLSEIIEFHHVSDHHIFWLVPTTN